MLGIKTHSIYKDYSLERNLGFGAYGEVKLGIHKLTKTLVAIKKLTLTGLSEQKYAEIQNEILLLIECVSFYFVIKN